MSKIEKTFAGGKPLKADELNNMAAAINDNDDQIASLREQTDTKFTKLESTTTQPFSNSELFNRYIKNIYSPNLDIDNIYKVGIGYKDGTLTFNFKNSDGTNILQFGSNKTGCFIKDGYCYLKDNSNNFLFLVVDFANISALTAAVLDIRFNEIVKHIEFSPVFLPYILALNEINFKDISIVNAETSKRISKYGEVVSANSNWSYTTPVQCKRGDIIEVKTDGNEMTSVISDYKNSVYTPLQQYDSSVSDNTYFYVCKYDINAVFSLYEYQNCFIKVYTNGMVKSLINMDIHGESAYKIWLNQGNTGTEQDFLNSLKGSDGVQGKQGPRGPQGPQGNSGYSGVAGELKVVNNTTEGGATAALSADAGKELGNATDYNAIPVIPNIKNPKPIASANIDASLWISDEEGKIVSNSEVYDFVHRKYVKSITTKVLTTALSSNNKIYTKLSESVDVTNRCVRYSLLIDDEVDLTKLSQIKLILGSGSINSNVRCTSVIWRNGADADHTYGGIVAGCINPVLLSHSSGTSFDPTSVDTIGFQIEYTTPVSAEIKIDVIQLDIVDGLSKPGIVLVVDNFEPSVVNMAEYAATKGVKLNLSVIPNWIGGSSASLDDIQRIKRLGHLIFNHTWNHNIGLETYAETSEGIFKADNWMIRNGMARGSKFVSNPSAFYNNIRYKAHMDSEALMVYHHWTPYPYGETGNGIYLISYPYYPAERFLNISGLDWNDFTPERLSYFKSLAEVAVSNKGIAVIGFHDSSWDVDGGISWKNFIDYIAEIQGIYFYGIDEIVEGLYC